MRGALPPMPPAEIRRRVPSHNFNNSDENEGSIRVISNNTPSSIASTSPCVGVANRSYRKAVQPIYLREGEEEEEKVEEIAVVRAGNILMEQVALQVEQQHRSSSVPSLRLLPSALIDCHSQPGSLQGKEMHSDQLYKERKGENNEGKKGLPANRSYNYGLREPSFPYDSRLPQLTIPAPNSGESPIQRFSEKVDDDAAGLMISSSSASSTLAEIGRSLQWSQKFPQGRHLSRAKSRTTLRSKNLSVPNLTEARAGLRLLAKRREDVIEENEEGSTRVARWNRFKCILFSSVLVVFAYGTFGLICSLLTWANAWEGAHVSVVVDTDIVILLTVASSLCLSTSMVGLSGTILNSRPILALYSFLLWPTLLSMLIVGYTSYKRNNLRLDLKLNQAWSRYLDDLARLRVQETLHCCGYYSPLHQATFSRHCYPRTTLPGCKGPLYRFEKHTFSRLYTVLFTIVFIHLVAIAISLLCSNHVNVTFGKGLTPRAYRLDVWHVRRNAINIIRILSSGASPEQTDVHHLLQVDNSIKSVDSSRASSMSNDSLVKPKQ